MLTYKFKHLLKWILNINTSYKNKKVENPVHPLVWESIHQFSIFEYHKETLYTHIHIHVRFYKSGILALVSLQWTKINSELAINNRLITMLFHNLTTLKFPVHIVNLIAQLKNEMRQVSRTRRNKKLRQTGINDCLQLYSLTSLSSYRWCL